MDLPDFSDGFDALIGLQLDEVGPDRVVGHWQVRPELLQPWGIQHGGVLCSVVESVASIGAGVWFGDRGTVVGTSNHTNFLRAVREGTLSACATPVHRGRSQQLWEVDITDEQQRLVAKGQVRLANLARRD